MKTAKVVCVLILPLLLITGIAFAQGVVSVTVNGKGIASDVPPIIQKGRVLVPLRFVAEALGANVSWDQNTRTAVIDTEHKAFANIVVGYDVTVDEDGFLSVLGTNMALFEKGYQEFKVLGNIYNLSAGSHSVKMQVVNGNGIVLDEQLQQHSVESDDILFVGYELGLAFETTGRHTIKLFVDDELVGRSFVWVNEGGTVI